MYASHAKYIQRAVEVGGFLELGHVVRFTLATIRFPLWQAASVSRVLITGEGDVEAARKQVLWGSKRRGFEYLVSPQGAQTLARTWLLGTSGEGRARPADPVGTLLELCRIPGLGLVKAGFVCQQAFGFGGCIDTHNLRLYDVRANDVSLGGVKVDGEVARRKAGAYLRLCGTLGGPERLWDAWCRYVAETQPKRYSDADDVSFQHLYGLGLAG